MNNHLKVNLLKIICFCYTTQLKNTIKTIFFCYIKILIKNVSNASDIKKRLKAF